MKHEHKLDLSSVSEGAYPPQDGPVPTTPARKASPLLGGGEDALYLLQVLALLQRLRTGLPPNILRSVIRVEDAVGQRLAQVQVGSLAAIEPLQEDLAYLGYAARGCAADGIYVFRHRHAVSVRKKR